MKRRKAKNRGKRWLRRYLRRQRRGRDDVRRWGAIADHLANPWSMALAEMPGMHFNFAVFWQQKKASPEPSNPAESPTEKK